MNDFLLTCGTKSFFGVCWPSRSQFTTAPALLILFTLSRSEGDFVTWRIFCCCGLGCDSKITLACRRHHRLLATSWLSLLWNLGVIFFSSDNGFTSFALQQLSCVIIWHYTPILHSEVNASCGCITRSVGHLRLVVNSGYHVAAKFSTVQNAATVSSVLKFEMRFIVCPVYCRKEALRLMLLGEKKENNKKQGCHCTHRNKRKKKTQPNSSIDGKWSSFWCQLCEVLHLEKYD